MAKVEHTSDSYVLVVAIRGRRQLKVCAPDNDLTDIMRTKSSGDHAEILI